MGNNKHKVYPPLYMAGIKTFCWRCEERMPVIMILAPKVEGTHDEICSLSGIKYLPKDILTFIKSKVPTFKMKRSKTTNETCFSNTCPKCGTLYGDFYLYDEPGALFFPTDKNDAKRLYITEIPVSKQVYIRTGLGSNTAYELILKHAKRI